MDRLKTKLNIGAGRSYIPGFINIDISERADISLNLSNDKLPFEDDSVDLVFSYHTLEHVPDYIFALSEIHRVLKDGGVFLLGVPYVTLTKYNLVNPYHLHNFNEYSFDFFDPLKIHGSAVEENDLFFQKIYHKFYYMGIFKVLPFPVNKWCRNHLFNVVKKIDFGLIAIKTPEKNISFGFTKSDLKRLFKSCQRARVPYVKDSEIRNKNMVKKIIRQTQRWWKGEI